MSQCDICLNDDNDGVACAECSPDYPEELRTANARIVELEKLVEGLREEDEQAREVITVARRRADKAESERAAAIVQVRQLEETIADLRRPVGTHENHLPDPPRHVGAFDTMKGALPRQPAAGEVLPPERRATPFRSKVPGIDS